MRGITDTLLSFKAVMYRYCAGFVYRLTRPQRERLAYPVMLLFSSGLVTPR